MCKRLVSPSINGSSSISSFVSLRRISTQLKTNSQIVKCDCKRELRRRRKIVEVTELQRVFYIVYNFRFYLRNIACDFEARDFTRFLFKSSQLLKLERGTDSSVPVSFACLPRASRNAETICQPPQTSESERRTKVEMAIVCSKRRLFPTNYPERPPPCDL